MYLWKILENKGSSEINNREKTRHRSEVGREVSNITKDKRDFLQSECLRAENDTWIWKFNMSLSPCGSLKVPIFLFPFDMAAISTLDLQYQSVWEEEIDTLDMSLSVSREGEMVKRGRFLRKAPLKEEFVLFLSSAVMSFFSL